METENATAAAAAEARRFPARPGAIPEMDRLIEFVGERWGGALPEPRSAVCAQVRAKRVCSTPGLARVGRARSLMVLWRMAAWSRFEWLSFWWVHLMVFLWLLFALMLFVFELLGLDFCFRTYALHERIAPSHWRFALIGLPSSLRRSASAPECWVPTATCPEHGAPPPGPVAA